MEKKQEADEKKSIEIGTTDANKLFPKLCTKFLLQKEENGDTYILTLLFENPPDPALIIDRVVITEKLKDGLIDMLSRGKSKK